jgi:hypothetical protein
MGRQVRAASLPFKLSQRVARDWSRAARLCIALITCLAQLSVTAQHRPVPGLAAPAMVYDTSAAGSGNMPARFDTAHASVPCAHHGIGARDSNNPVPCPCRDCPFCPCPCCAPLHAAIGILPQEMSRAAYTPRFAKIAPSPVRLCAAVRFAIVAGQPRAPPILI